MPTNHQRKERDHQKMLMLMLKSFLLLLVSLLLSQQCLGGIVEETCKRAANSSPNIDYSFCVSSLQADPRSRGADLFELGLITCDLCSTFATKTSSYITLLLKNPGLNPVDKSCLNGCSKIYSDALYTLKLGEEYYKNKRYLEANVWIGTGTDYSDYCESGFKEKNRPSPLTKENKDFFDLVAITLAITNFLRQ